MTSGPAGSLTYGDINHMHAVTTLGNMPNPYAAYDAMGNMTCRNIDTTSGHTCGSSPTGAQMSYDNEGRLASWTAPSGTTASDGFLYDNAGNRVLQRVSTSTVTDTITFDGYTETVLSGGTTTTTKYYSVGGMRVALKTSGVLSYLLSDGLSSTTVALSSTGSTQAVQLFAPYGSVRYSQGGMPTTYNFTGERLDSQTGLLYYGSRYYDPLSGRFVRADTVQTNAGGRDPYAYVGNNPETTTDPTGHMPCAGAGRCSWPSSPPAPPSQPSNSCTATNCSVTVNRNHYSTSDLYNVAKRRQFFADFYAQFARGYDKAELDFFDYLRRTRRLDNLSGYWNFVDLRLALDQLMAAFDILNHHAAQNAVVRSWLGFLAHPGNNSWWVAHNGSIDTGDRAARATGVYGLERTAEQYAINDAVHIINDIQFVSQGDSNPLGSWLGPQSSLTGLLNKAFEPQQYNDTSDIQALATQALALGAVGAAVGFLVGLPLKAPVPGADVGFGVGVVTFGVLFLPSP